MTLHIDAVYMFAISRFVVETPCKFAAKASSHHIAMLHAVR